MAVREIITAKQSGGYVPEATPDTPSGMLKEIERMASNRLAETRRSIGLVEEQLKYNKIADQEDRKKNAEASLYGSLAVETLTPGLSLIGNVLGLVDERASEKGSISHHAEPQKIEEHIAGTTNRAPGLYREDPHQKPFGSGRTDFGEGHDLSNLSVATRADLVGYSLCGQAKEKNNLIGDTNNSTPNVPDFRAPRLAEIMGPQSVEYRFANERALDSVRREQAFRAQGPSMGMGGGGMTMGLNMDLNNGPKGPKWSREGALDEGTMA